MFDELLRFAEVGHVALRVRAPREESKILNKCNFDEILRIIILMTFNFDEILFMTFNFDEI